MSQSLDAVNKTLDFWYNWLTMENVQYARYLIKKFKDIGIQMVNIKKFLIDKEHHIKLYEDTPQYGEKKCCWLGGNIIGHFIYLSNGTRFIPFDFNWKDYGNRILCIDDEVAINSSIDFLASCFLQMMAISKRHDIWLNDKVIFEKGNAYVYLMEAELYG